MLVQWTIVSNLTQYCSLHENLPFGAGLELVSSGFFIVMHFVHLFTFFYKLKCFWKLKSLYKYLIIIFFICNAYLGTAIEQGEAPDFYFQKYSEANPVLGFFTWRWVLTLGFDHMFSSPIFLGTLVLLGASLMACTYTTQIPLVKVARRFEFY